MNSLGLRGLISTAHFLKGVGKCKTISHRISFYRRGRCVPAPGCVLPGQLLWPSGTSRSTRIPFKGFTELFLHLNYLHKQCKFSCFILVPSLPWQYDLCPSQQRRQLSLPMSTPLGCSSVEQQTSQAPRL